MNFTYNYPAAVDLSGSWGLYTKYDSGLKIATAGTIGSEVLMGFVNEGGGNTSGLTTSITLIGECDAIASEAIAIGDKLTPTAGGKMAVATAGKSVVAVALAAASGNNKRFKVLACVPMPWTLDTVGA